MEGAGIKKNTIVYNAAVQACLNPNPNPNPKPKPKPNPKPSPNPSPIQACQRGGAWKEAVQLADAMQAQGISRDTITYNSLIRVCEGAGQWQTAFDFMKEMKGHEIR